MYDTEGVLEGYLPKLAPRRRDDNPSGDGSVMHRFSTLRVIESADGKEVLTLPPQTLGLPQVSAGVNAFPAVVMLHGFGCSKRDHQGEGVKNV